MTQTILIKRADGGVSILRVYPQEKIIEGEDGVQKVIEIVDVDTAIRKWKEQALPGEKYVSHRKIDAAGLPTDRTFRDAWTDGNPTIDVDMTKARAIHLGRLRRIRDERLSALDVPYIRALEADDGERKKEIAAKKQALRDMPDNVNLDAIETPEELKAFMPTEMQ